MAHRNIRQPALAFSGASWGDVFNELAEWADTHQRSSDYTVAMLQDELLPSDNWTLLEGVLLDVSPDVDEGDPRKYTATLFYG